MKYVVNPGKWPCTLNGIKFLPGIFAYDDEVIMKAQMDPMGRGNLLGSDRLPMFNSLSELEANMATDDIEKLILLSFDSARTEGTLSHGIEKLRELYHGFSNQKLKDVVIEIKSKLERGDRPSWFRPYEGPEAGKFVITL
jgi:hypothetical protein